MNSASQGTRLVPPPWWVQDGQDPAGRVEVGFLAALALLGAVLRLYALGAQSLWVDEIMSWQMVRPGVGLVFWEQVRDSIQGPLLTVLTWPLVRFADTAIMLRLPSALAGIAGVLVFGLLAYRVLNRRAARVALLLMALNPFHVWYSQEARGYSLLVFFSLLSFLIFWRLVCEGPRFRRLPLFVLANAAAVWSNMSGVFYLLTLVLVLLFYFRPQTGKAWRFWSLGFSLSFLLVLPWLLKATGIWAVERLVPGAGLGQALRAETTFPLAALPYSFFTFFFGYSLGPSLRELHGADRLELVMRSWPLLAACALPVTIGLVCGLPAIFRKQRWLLLMICLPILVLAVLALRNIKPWNVRYLALVVPWLLALLAAGLVRLPRWPGLLLTGLLVGLMLWSLAGYYFNGRYAKADLRAAAVAVENLNGSADPVLVPVVSDVFTYYYSGLGEILNSFNYPALNDGVAADQFCSEVLAGRERCLYVQAREWFFDPQGVLPTALNRLGRLQLESIYPGVRVYSWTRAAAR